MVVTYPADQYRAQLLALFPTGAAWPREAGTNLYKLCDAIAGELGEFDARMAQLGEEMDPRTAFEMLGDWEHVLGLPDAFTAAGTTLAARQAAALRKLAWQAGQTPAFYEALAASIGYEIEIHEFDPDVDDFDGSLTALITGGRWRYVWRVHVLNGGTFSFFHMGDQFGGQFVEGDVSLDLEGMITAAKPAHTHVIFSYPEA